MNQKKSILQNASILARICVTGSLHNIDPSNYSFLVGVRPPFFSLLDLQKFSVSLKTSFLLIESFLNSNFPFIIILKSNHPILFLKFYQICKKNNILLLKDSEVTAGFLTNKVQARTSVLTLFSDTRKTELIQKECLRLNFPLISFADITVNQFSSSIVVAGNYSSFTAQNFILTMLSVCFEQKKKKNGKS